jgi:membrane protease YdiL (CAAX protease family)
MTTPNWIRAGQFLGLLALLGGLVVITARLANIDVVSLAPVYMFTPMVAAAAITWYRDLSWSSVGLRIGQPRWLAVATVLALPLVGLTLALALAVPQITFDAAANPTPGLPLPSGILGVVAPLALVLALGATINALFAFGEEFGWRGYLLWELAPLGFWKASFTIGAIWGLWHAPIILAGYNYPSFPVIGVGMMTLAGLAFSPVYTYVVVRAEYVFAAALLHGVFNASAGLVLANATVDDATLSELVASPVGVAGIVAFALAALVIAITGTPTLTRDFADGKSAEISAARASLVDD